MTELTQDEQNELDFIAHTNYMFEWKECNSLVRGEDEPTVYAENVTLEEALELIEQHYTPIPF